MKYKGRENKKRNSFEIKTYFYPLAFFFSLAWPFFLFFPQIKAYEFKASHLHFNLSETNIRI